NEIGYERETPPAKLRAIAEIEVLGERIVLPPAGIVDRFAATHTGRAVEIEESAGPISAAMLEHEVTVEENRLNLRQERIVLIDVTPARLHHPDSSVAEVRHQTRQKIGRRN